MGTLAPTRLPWSDQLGLLWAEIRDGTFVYRDPTDVEKAASRARREQLARDSSVPWILNDLAGLMQFYDDAQDIVSFARWSKKLWSPSGLRACIARQTALGGRQASALLTCLCPLGAGGPKRITQKSFVGWGGLVPLLTTGLLALFPGFAALGFPLLAGQVALTVFGVGLRLGPLVGAAVEVFYRGLDSLGLPFGPEHNKYHELKRARLLQRIDKGVGALPYLEAGDALTTLTAAKFAMQPFPGMGPVVIKPQDYPRLGDLLTDPFGTLAAAASLGTSLLSNVGPYLWNDLLGPAVSGLSNLLGGSGAPPPAEMPPEGKVAMAMQHEQKCPNGAACRKAINAAYRHEQWARQASDLEGYLDDSLLAGDEAYGADFWFRR